MNNIFTRFFLFFFIFSSILHAQKQVEGTSVRIIDNRKDIYHDKNEIHRKLLIKESILDAIEKGADVSVKNIISYNVENVSIDNYEQSFEDFVSKTLQEYHVIWRRSSQFEFSRDKNKKKKWTCRVRGEVINKEFDPSGFEDAVTSSINGVHNYNTSFYVTRKSFGKVHIGAGLKDGVKIGNKFIVYKYINKKSIVGYNTIKKPKAQIYITSVGDDYAIGNIIRGYYRQLERNQVEYGIFKLNRGGFKYELFLQEDKLKLTNLGKNKKQTVDMSITGHGVTFTHWGYLSKWGFEIGCDFLDLRTSSLSDVAINLKLGGYRNISIVPELFYFQPKVHIGYMFANINEEKFFDLKKDARPFTFEGKLGCVFALYSVDFSAGMSYRYVHLINELTNFYPYFGIGINLYR